MTRTPTKRDLERAVIEIAIRHVGVDSIKRPGFRGSASLWRACRALVLHERATAKKAKAFNLAPKRCHDCGHSAERHAPGYCVATVNRNGQKFKMCGCVKFVRLKTTKRKDTRR